MVKVPGSEGGMAVSFRQVTLHEGGTNWPIMCPPTVKVGPLCQPREELKQVCGLILYRCKVRTAQESRNRRLRDRCCGAGATRVRVARLSQGTQPRECSEGGHSDSKHAGAVHNWSEPSGGSIYFSFYPYPFPCPIQRRTLSAQTGAKFDTIKQGQTRTNRDKHRANITINTNLARNGCARQW